VSAPSPLPLVYVAHPFAGDVDGNTRRVEAICRRLVAGGVLPVAPQIYLPAFVDERHDRERALRLCMRLLEACDEVHVFDERGVTDGMLRELAHARRHRVPITCATAAPIAAGVRP